MEQQVLPIPDFSARKDAEGQIINEICPTIIQHLQGMAWLEQMNGFSRQLNWYDYLMDNGTARKGKPLPEGEEFMERGACYSNSLEYVCDWDEHHYTEGLAWRGLIVVRHAWVEDDDGNVIDLTWRPEDGEIQDPTTWEYLGIGFQTLFVADLVMKYDEMGVLDKKEVYEND